MTGDRQRPWPLFLRIFVLILLTVLLVQLLNFAAVLLMPPPTPAIYSTNRIAQVVRAGNDTTGLLTSSLSRDPPHAGGDERDRRLARLIAADLRLPAAAVRVEGHRNGPPMMVGAFRAPVPMGLPGPPPPSFAMDNGLFGSFAVSVRVAPGLWRVIRPAGSVTGPWRARLILWLLVAIAVAAPIAWALARRVAKPIGLFAAAAERLGRDPRAPPLPLSGPPEIAEAATAFNLMQERLNRYVEDRTMLIAAVAHDLRTPLMRLSLRLEKASDAVRIASEEDIQEMSQRIGAAMAFVRDMTRDARRQRLDLRSLAESITDQCEDRGEQVALAPGPALTIDGDGPALKALLANLIENAVKYAGAAEVTLRREGDVAIIEVADRGPGLVLADLDQAFEPFFRADRSRNRDTGGSGLGLASVRAVARAHGGEAMLENRPGGGLLARVTLPG
ncbi:HAMP domain-containing sensor histidine kinase [Sphingomonas hylomeconis]|uniref:histidine kinase n=1 Tax=Sphingomonas hylomeconis TaxID=1395958 RepID=A0ABV7SX06_9SPHN|nr:HAMP domain-containing sensor histidine kinase [Sphingomonas hylomeconis]